MANEVSKIYSDIAELLNVARVKAYHAVNSIMVETYWKIGQRIVEEEQGGSSRAEYGTKLIENLSKYLTDTFGKTSKSILELILSKEDNVSLEEITPLLRKNLKSTPEEILEAVQGNLTHEQNSKMKICLDHYDTLIECIDNI